MRASAYSEADTARRLREHHVTQRSEFARDRARLVHSSALRRLAAKTQVLSPTAGLDFARNRLTHSLEVAQIGRELGGSLGLDPDVVDGACLSHDLGHPPFGHNGERALDEWSADAGGFEGNAQTLRILTRLEPKIFGPDGAAYGLNLTRASLDAACKYPWARGEAPDGGRKFGYYEDDADWFAWLRDGAPAGRRSIEAQAMDLADDIAYSVHDFEDAVVAGYIDVVALGAKEDHDDLVDAIAEWVGDSHSRDELAEAFDRLHELEFWIDGWSGGRRDTARLKNLTSQLIGRFVSAATSATREAFPQGSLARYGADIVVPRDISAEIGVLKGVVAAYVMNADTRQPVYQEQRRIIVELADTLLARAPAGLEPGFVADWTAATDDAARTRVVVDQIASLTDPAAIAWHARLTAR